MLVAALAGLALAAAPVLPQAGMMATADVPVSIGAPLDPGQAANLSFTLFRSGIVSLPGFDWPAHVGGLEFDGAGNRWLLTTESFAVLPGGLAVGPQDVVALTDSGFTLLFDGSAQQVPAGAAIDALALQGSDLLLSFDVTVALPGGLVADDEDIVRWSGGTFVMDFDGSAYGLEDGLDVDGIYIFPDYRLVLSFDGDGTLGGVPFDDEDLMAWNGTWVKAAELTGWLDATGAADLEDFSLLPGLVFEDGFASGDLSRWSRSLG